MWTKRQGLVGKAIVAVIGAGALLAFAVPTVLAVLDRDWPDQGTRPLIVIATEGGDRPYGLHVRSKVESDGTYKFAFYFSTGEDSGGPSERFELDYQVVVIGDDVAGAVSCGDSSQEMTNTAKDKLREGPRYAFDMDQKAVKGSATNYKFEATQTAAEPADSSATSSSGDDDVPSPVVPSDGNSREESLDVLLYVGKIWTQHQDEPANLSRSVTETGAVFAEECRLESSAAWAEPIDDPMSNAQSTLLPPQFNFTSLGASTDFQSGADTRLWIDRPDGVTLSESYPTPVATASGWTLWHSWSSMSSLGSPGHLHYTDQPVLMVANRDAARAEQAMLLFGGMAIALALTLIVRALSDIIDAVARD